MRKDLLQLAESFLNSDNVKDADKEKKTEFLKTKGLNDKEIEEAFRRVNSSKDKTPLLPPRPSAAKLVYYQTLPPRMTNIQICIYAIVVALGTLGITATITAVVKKVMTRILKSIAKYQANRYRETKQVFEHIEVCIKKQYADSRLDTEQTKLNNSLDRIVQLARQVKDNRKNPYEDLKLNIDEFRNAVLRQPLSSSHQYGASGFINLYHDQGNKDMTIQNIKSEIRSVKGMLLSRRNFPVVTPAAVIKHSVIPVPKEQPPIYHPRRKRSFRSELNSSISNSTA